MARLRPQDAERRKLNAASADFSEALARGLQIMCAYDEKHQQMSISDLSRIVDLPRATVRRTLLTLVSLGYAEADGRMFRLTPRTLRLASAYLMASPVTSSLQPACDRLAQATNETCLVATLDDTEVVTICFALPPQTMPGGTGIGYRLPVYCTALGRVMLASKTDAEVDSHLARVRLEKLTEFTETDPAVIRRDIARVREQGYSFMDQQAEYGYRSIAVPIHRFDGKVVGALNIGGRAGRTTAEQMQTEYLHLLRDCAEDLRLQLLA